MPGGFTFELYFGLCHPEEASLLKEGGRLIPSWAQREHRALAAHHQDVSVNPPVILAAKDLFQRGPRTRAVDYGLALHGKLPVLKYHHQWRDGQGHEYNN